jgi:hypothetical protein
MKNNNPSVQPSKFSADSRNRMLAYSTAVGLGAFFGGQNGQAAVVQAPGLGTYPVVLLPGPIGSPNGTDHYLNFDGGDITNFDLYIGADLLSHATNKYPAQVVDLYGIVADTNNPSVLNGQPLCPPWTDGSTNAYIGAFWGGMVIDNNTNTFTPDYAPRLALAYNGGSSYPFYNYHWNDYGGFPQEFSGFEFTGSDGQNHFGYMDVKVNFALATAGADTEWVVTSVVISDCRYETTPNTGITVPSSIQISSFTQDPANGNLITINFGPNWANDNTSQFALETSPTLGPSATWVTDPQALVTQIVTANRNAPAGYQALTYPTAGAATQYWRIRKL